jgi:hypothetical protein
MKSIINKKMSVKVHDLKKVSSLKSPDLRMPKWLDKRLIFKGYSFPIKNILVFFVAPVVAVLLAIIIFFAVSGKNIQVDPNLAIERETADLTQKIGKFMELPAGEQPTLATVTDRAKLKGQDFFESAQNGDKVLIYPKAKKAILYRPSIGKIIEVAHLTSGSGNSGDVQTPLDGNANPN